MYFVFSFSETIPKNTAIILSVSEGPCRLKVEKPESTVPCLQDSTVWFYWLEVEKPEKSVLLLAGKVLRYRSG